MEKDGTMTWVSPAQPKSETPSEKPVHLLRTKIVCSPTNSWTPERVKTSGPKSSTVAHLQQEWAQPSVSSSFMLSQLENPSYLLFPVVWRFKLCLIHRFSFCFHQLSKATRRDCVEQDNSFVEMVHDTCGNLEATSFPARVWGYFIYVWISPCEMGLCTTGRKRWVCPFTSSLAGLCSLWSLLLLIAVNGRLLLVIYLVSCSKI